MRNRKQEMTHVRRRASLATGWWTRLGILGLLLAATSMVSPAQDEQASTHSVKFTTLHIFDYTDGEFYFSGPPLIQATNGNLYGTTYGGGAHDRGTVFEITPSGKLTTLYSFCSQSSCTDGANPYTPLVQATNGDLYGTTLGDGANGKGGTVFKITPSGTLTTLYSFCSQSDCTDGNGADWLIQATDGNFYGTTFCGGAYKGTFDRKICTGGGTVFKIKPTGTLTTLYSFCSKSDCTDGDSPTGLIQATNGDFYGTANDGGAHDDGTVFKITPGGKLTTLHSFAGSPTDGANPYAPPVQATNGNFYGTASGGGPNATCTSMGVVGCGTVFEITPSDTLRTLYNFCSQSGCTDGAFLYPGLIQATDGNFYGTTTGLGANGYGTVFKITPSGTLTTLHSFDGTDGNVPNGLIQATNGNFYGTTEFGGANHDGNVFKISPSGTLTTLYSFCALSGCTDGGAPMAGLVQDTNGKFYGTTFDGGASSDGTVFSLSVGLGPFVETQPASGKVGAAVKILGTDLTGATKVTFNGTAAVFKVVSSSEITTTVPRDATTGKVRVTTPHGTLSSNVPFRVTCP